MQERTEGVLVRVQCQRSKQDRDLARAGIPGPVVDFHWTGYKEKVLTSYQITTLQMELKIDGYLKKSSASKYKAVYRTPVSLYNQLKWFSMRNKILSELLTCNVWNNEWFACTCSVPSNRFG